MSKRPFKLGVIGGGNRGRAYSEFANLYPDRLSIRAIADPLPSRRTYFENRFRVPPQRQYESWQKMIQDSPDIDGVVIATPDRVHVEPTVACAKVGWHILLEKPMAVDSHGLQEIYKAINLSKVFFALGHVLLYAPLTNRLLNMVHDGQIGEIVSIQRTEPIGYWHFAHSYVRGNWQSEKSSSPLLLAKACHDIDWILELMGRDVRYVSSFGRLNHFTPKSRPPKAADRCVRCPVESSCPFSAKRFYQQLFDKGEWVWPLDTVIEGMDQALLDYALVEGPYGKCVWDSPNDVVDNQVVNLEFGSAKTANLTLTAFSDVSDRKTSIYGTRGMIETDGSTIRTFDFFHNQWVQEYLDVGDATAAGGHGGGDFGLMDAFLGAWEHNDQSRIKSSVENSIYSHEIVFAAEKARKNYQVIKVDV